MDLIVLSTTYEKNGKLENANTTYLIVFSLRKKDQKKKRNRIKGLEFTKTSSTKDKSKFLEHFPSKVKMIWSPTRGN